MKATAILRRKDGPGTDARSFPRSPDGRFSRVSDEAEIAEAAWHACDPARLFALCGIADANDEGSADFAKACGLVSRRACPARIVRVSHGKGWAPGFRPAMTGEAGEDAVLIPLTIDATTINFSACGVHGAPDWRGVADVLAIVHPSGAPLSLTGASAAVGGFAQDGAGGIRLYTNGFAWLKRWLSAVASLAEDHPPRLAAKLAPPPEEMGTLILDWGAHEWRYWREGSPVTAGAKKILCADSPALAEHISRVMRSKEKFTLPEVLAPAQKKAVAA